MKLSTIFRRKLGLFTPDDYLNHNSVMARIGQFLFDRKAILLYFTSYNF
jgi:hypothetical protein